jgi:hypothetical protein
MFFGGSAGQRKENMSVMGGAFFNGLVFHGVSHNIGNRRIQFAEIFNSMFYGLEYFFGQPFFHYGHAEYIGAESVDRIDILVIDRRLNVFALIDGHNGV